MFAHHMAVITNHLIMLAHHMAMLANHLIMFAHHMAMLANHLIMLAHHMAMLANHLVMFPKQILPFRRKEPTAFVFTFSVAPLVGGGGFSINIWHLWRPCLGLIL
jgi:hypothetical protein